jgi:creatinine amidohydrolase
MLGRYLETMTWDEAEPALREFPVVVLPVGARTKEHGRHLQLNNDWLLAEYLARRVVDRCRVLVLPTLQYGYYPAFREYPGSVSLSLETMRDTVVQICQSHARHGARRFYALNTGISTLRALAPAAERLAEDGIAFAWTDLEEAGATVVRALVTQAAGTHADEIETSMMLYIAPETVRMERAEPDVHPAAAPGPLTRTPDPERGIYSPTGAYGDPTAATRDKGERIVEAMVGDIVAFLDDFATRAP